MLLALAYFVVGIIVILGVIYAGGRIVMHVADRTRRH